MRIHEAFELSDKAECEGVKFERSWGEAIPLKLALSDDWQPVYEPLTFERIKRECVAGETLFCISGGSVLFIGFNRQGELITDNVHGLGAFVWHENEIEDWKISKEKWKG